MRRTTVEAEISARSYKKLCAELRGFNKKQLWKVLDHYIFHIMEDKHVEELLQILKQFEQTNSFEDLPPPPTKVEQPQVVAQFEAVNEPVPERRMVFSHPITAEDLKRSKNQLDLLYDVNYFSYLTPEVAVGNAQALLEYTERNSLPVSPHWRFIAASGDFFDLEEEEDE